MIMPIFDYGCIVWMECTKQISHKIEKLQNRAMRIILKTDRKSCSQDMRCKLIRLIVIVQPQAFPALSIKLLNCI